MEAATYRYSAGPLPRTLSSPSTARTNPDVDDEVVARWRASTEGGFTATRLPGGHFHTDEVLLRLPAAFACFANGKIGAHA